MKLDLGVPRRRARVEMIPLIDCVFVVLVFFIYSMLAMTLRRGVIVQLPEARTLQASQEEAVVITITGEGEVMVGDRAVEDGGLGQAIDEALSRLQTPRVVVNADTSSRHGVFVEVIDELKFRGIDEVVMLAQDRQTP